MVKERLEVVLPVNGRVACSLLEAGGSSCCRGHGCEGRGRERGGTEAEIKEVRETETKAKGPWPGTGTGTKPSREEEEEEGVSGQGGNLDARPSSAIDLAVPSSVSAHDQHDHSCSDDTHEDQTVVDRVLLVFAQYWRATCVLTYSGEGVEWTSVVISLMMTPHFGLDLLSSTSIRADRYIR